jgi:hypothetical protein
MPKTSRLTRIGEFVSTSNHLKGQRDPTPVQSRPTRIGDNTSSSHHPEGQFIPTPECETKEVHVTRRRNPKKLTFQGHCFNGTQLGTANKMMRSKAVPDGLLPQECNMRSRCGYLQSPNQDEREEAMDKIATCQEAHSSGKGGV